MPRKSFKQHTLQLAGGFDCGPLFIVQKRRPPRRAFSQAHGRIRRQAERRAMPGWVDRDTIAAFWRASRAATKATGVQHSVGHIVPLQHPLVCGLHVPANLCVEPLRENMHKGNRWWPDMWGEQPGLFE